MARKKIARRGKHAPAGKVASNTIYQFKITLIGSKPPIWRRIEVEDGPLDNLHGHIQRAMGWTNSHLHQFDIGGEQYGEPELLDDGFGGSECHDSLETTIGEIVPKNGKPFRFKYEYDFGDGWEHEILFEGCCDREANARYPRCVEGKRACPPEDVGGLWGYQDFLEALADPKSPQRAEMLEWVGGEFDPEAFDPAAATKAMQRATPN
ncbi:MAG TPA: plasmid pRiA4b ORF-3 family protein [Pirellulales bacterium]|nr:plasmid pRiA4b ORF-3 family protein [Pirellulales bacterium]